ncbi:hypothetical protein KDH_61070 [Dictyobacter sp. S3.2.2.5]|uniref:Secreted protein n=1 Tax=Dictyobacter halimunensis TaxID=3026934 RepID=A0ABQ6FYB0_9CHLR|nr:hypothetical protein KDH_61070 [Dictyobacter sp. S3.2.2.5]
MHFIFGECLTLLFQGRLSAAALVFGELVPQGRRCAPVAPTHYGLLSTAGAQTHAAAGDNLEHQTHSYKIME